MSHRRLINARRRRLQICRARGSSPCPTAPRKFAPVAALSKREPSLSPIVYESGNGEHSMSGPSTSPLLESSLQSRQLRDKSDPLRRTCAVAAPWGRPTLRGVCGRLGEIVKSALFYEQPSAFITGRCIARLLNAPTCYGSRLATARSYSCFTLIRPRGSHRKGRRTVFGRRL